MHSYGEYIALGDSLSMDLFAALDVGETDVAVALEREPAAGNVAPLGPASLLFQNDDARYPEEQGQDLVSWYPGIALRNLAGDSASIGEVFGEQLSQVDDADVPTLFTLTAGGNDLFSAFQNKPRAGLLEAIARDVRDAYEFLVDAIRRARPHATVIISTVLDPSDGLGTIPGVLEAAGPLPLGVLEAMNEHIRVLAAGTPGVELADLHARFLGHGASVPEEERWYWRRSMVEPNARGAHEIRCVWREVLDQL